MDLSNLDHWEQLAGIHGIGPDRYYDLEALIRGDTLMGAEEATALDVATAGAGVTGLDVLHLQCHLGCDAITMARQGAHVTGVDFSPIAIARMSDLAARCGVEVTPVVADSRALPDQLNSSFDLVYATIGVLCWIDDLAAWMDSVSRVLRPNGTLVLVELHPLLTMIDTVDPLVVDFPYGFDGGHVFVGTGSYANPDAAVAWSTTQYAHSIAEVFMAAMGAGLRTTYLEEHTSMSFDPRGMADKGLEQDGRFRLRLGEGALVGETREQAHAMPVLFTLLATKT
jgi:SAM-dependent methyltransferase